jgi:hypothetical protein
MLKNCNGAISCKKSAEGASLSFYFFGIFAGVWRARAYARALKNWNGHFSLVLS